MGFLSIGVSCKGAALSIPAIALLTRRRYRRSPGGALRLAADDAGGAAAASAAVRYGADLRRVLRVQLSFRGQRCATSICHEFWKTSSKNTTIIKSASVLKTNDTRK